MQRSARYLLAGLAALALLGAVPAAAAVSPAVGKALNAAASAAKAGNSSAAISAIKQAEAAASTSEEKTKTAQMAAYVYTRAGRYGEAAKALESTGASPRQIAPLYYQAGQYDKAITEAKKAGGEDMQILIAQADTKLGRHKEAVAAYQTLIKANGPKPIYLENLAGAQYKAGDKAGYLATTEKLIRVDSSPARWNTLLVNFRQNPMRPEAKLATYDADAGDRHARQAGGLPGIRQAGAGARTRPAWRRQALAKGGATTDAMGAKMAQAAASMTAKAPAEAPKLAANPSTALRGANAYFGMGQYAKAIEVYQTRSSPPTATTPIMPASSRGSPC